jgi:hypothetical protein
MRIRNATRTTRLIAGLVLAGAALFGTAGAATADGHESAKAAAPTEAGTSFRTATEIAHGQEATAEASAGDYLYWVFPADAQERVTVKATVTPAEAAARRGTATWQIDVYDGLRRRQACMYGAQTRRAAADAASVELSCTLRTVHGWAEPWSDDPLPGSYYVRLTVIDLPEEDLGLPVKAAVRIASVDVGGAAAVDGALAAPLVPGATAADSGDSGDVSDSEDQRAAGGGEPEDGWSSPWWSDRWVWTAVGGVLAALAGVAGYTLTRGSGRPSHVPPGA